MEARTAENKACAAGYAGKDLSALCTPGFRAAPLVKAKGVKRSLSWLPLCDGPMCMGGVVCAVVRPLSLK